MPEKLLSIREVAAYLKISEEEVKRLVDIGEIPAYKIGDTFLRFRKEQIDAIRMEISEVEAEEAAPHPYADLEREIRHNGYTPAERIKDFFYFHDFYILCLGIMVLLLYLILR